MEEIKPDPVAEDLSNRDLLIRTHEQTKQILEKVSDFETRIRTLEKFKNYLTGAYAALATIAASVTTYLFKHH